MSPTQKKLIMKVVQGLQEIGIAARLKFQKKRSCEDCSRGCVFATGDGWNKARDYEWGCWHQEADLKQLVDAYENVVGKVDYNFATICPIYQKITENKLFDK